MNTPARILVRSALLIAATCFTACVKQVEQAAPAPQPPPPADAFSTAAATAPAAGTPSVAGIPAAAISLAERTKAKVELAATATADNGVVFKQAQALFAEKKYAEALRVLDTIQRELLTPAQEKAVSDLRTQLTRALETGL
jgi:hypothetical protein